MPRLKRPRKENIMNKLLPLLLLLFFEGCEANHVDDGCSQLTVKHFISRFMFVGIYEGHEYIMSVRGGIVHSESCPCKKERKNENP